MSTSTSSADSLLPVVTELNHGWEVAERLPPGRDLFFLKGGDHIWLPASVPGHVHLDLQKAGVIGDPYYRLHDTGSRWIDEVDWSYRKTFVVTAERLAASGDSGRHFLDFGGLDTVARVYLNGTLIGASENGYLPHRFDVTESLIEGENALRVEFDSAWRVGSARASAYLGDGTSDRGQQSYFNFGPRAFVRKPQYEFGWDWGPELISCGITGSVELVTVQHAEITEWRMEYAFTDPVTVDITVTLTVEKYSDQPLTAGVALYTAGDNTPAAVLPDAPGTHTVVLKIKGQTVAPWNPNGQDILLTSRGLSVRSGSEPQKRYLLNLRVWTTNADQDADKEFVYHKGVSVGFKKLELVREPDADGKGEGFKFRVNGIDTYILGANWIPNSSFPATISEAELRRQLTLARDAGFNMMRVWGGGLYESETFYQLCDELGLLVWQDFPFACSLYPDDLPEFVDAVRAEAVAAIKRIRHRVSLALWCGGNENMELHQGKWAGVTQGKNFYGDHIIHETLPSALAEADTATPYWPNSPYSGDNVSNVRDENYGDYHYWAVWHSHDGSNGDWTNYALSDCRFSSEFGFAASCGYTAWESCTIPADRTPRSTVAKWHDKTRKGYETYLGYIEMHFPKVETWDDLVYYSQANQAMALSYGIEHWRRRKGRCWGTLFWQFNDCWPTQSWAVVDSAGEGRIAYFEAKRTFYAPVLVSLVEKDGAVEAHVVNDTQLPVSGKLTLSLLSFDGSAAPVSEAVDVKVAANATNSDATPALVVAIPNAIATDRNRFYYHVALVAADGKTIGENILFLDEPKNLQLVDPELKQEVVVGDKGTATVTLTAGQFAGFVYLHLDPVPTAAPQFSDNGFHLLAGETKAISVSNLPQGLSETEFSKRLRVRHL